jgi:phosphatidylglycerol:prolipoprotein diacylglycerol transferase
LIPEVFHFGPLAISPFGIVMVAAFLAARAQLLWGLRRLDAGDADEANAIVLAGGLWGLVGAKLYYAFLHGDWRLSLDWLRSGLVWYGGFLLAVVAILWTIRRRRMHAWPTADAAAPALALGYAIGRIGCFLVGDDYGMPTDLPWGVAFPRGLPGPTTAEFMQRTYGAEIPAGVAPEALVPVHPTQLYETFLGLAIWGLGILLTRRGLRPGSVVTVVVALLAAERFGVEFLRAKDDRLLGEMTLAQLISVLVVVVALWAWTRRPRAREAGSAQTR